MSLSTNLDLRSSVPTTVNPSVDLSANIDLGLRPPFPPVPPTINPSVNHCMNTCVNLFCGHIDHYIPKSAFDAVTNLVTPENMIFSENISD